MTMASPRDTKQRTNATKVDIAANKLRLEQMMLRGVESTQEAAMILGHSEQVITQWKKQIADKWLARSNGAEFESVRGKRISQLDYLARLALEEFETSKQTSIETVEQWSICKPCQGKGIQLEGLAVPSHIRDEVFDRDEWKCVSCGGEQNLSIDHILPRSKGGSHQISNLRVLCMSCNRIKSNKLAPDQKCPDCCGMGEDEYLPGQIRNCLTCKGTGAKPDIPACVACLGTGRDLITTTKTKRQTGDVAYLNMARTAFVEAAKLEGIYPTSGMNKATFVKETMTRIADGVGGEIHERTREIYMTSEVDLLVQSMAIIDRIERGVSKGIVTSTVLDKDEPEVYEAERFKSKLPKT